MASDLYDVDWGDDPFDGDINFDMDFNTDPNANKGFVSGMASGFLSGLTTSTVGDSKAKIRSLRTILPSSFSTALDKVNFIDDRLEELTREFKEENFDTAKSLQSIASKLSQRMGSHLPGFANNGLDNFSQKDFSSWEKLSGDFNNRNNIEQTEDYEVEQAIDSSVGVQSSMFSALGESLNSMTATVGSQLQSAIGVSNRQLVNIESSVRDLMVYHRTVQAKLHQSQLTIQVRSYLQDAKFYKFMEAGIHQEVDELKRIVKNTAMSEFEKTSTLTAGKAYMRDKIFNTVGQRAGGITGLFRDKFSEGNRKEGYGLVGSLIGGLDDMMDTMSDGPMSRGTVGAIFGKMVARVAVDQLPVFFQRGPGKKAIDKLIKVYPEQGAWLTAQVKQLSDIGNIVSYGATSGMGLANHFAENYQPMDENKFLDYDDYRSSLQPGQKPLPRAVWTALNTAGNASKSAVNKLMSDVTRTRGTQYTLSRRNVQNLLQPSVWTNQSNVTLNEVIPGLISRTNQILEQIRTGDDAVEKESFNYMRGQFQTESQRKVSTQADLMPHSEFSRYAAAALELVDSIDPGKLLSGGARKALAKQISIDIDREKGFNPYYYLGDIPGISDAYQTEIKVVLKRHFGIGEADVENFNKSDTAGKMKIAMKMPTEGGRANLNAASASAANIKANFPNVAERIDLLRATGNEQLLRDLGVIYTEAGIDKVNIQLFYDRIGQYMDDPNNPTLRGQLPPGASPKPGLGNGFGPRPQGPTPSPSATNPFSDLNDTMAALTGRIDQLVQVPTSPADMGATASFDGVSGTLTTISENTAQMVSRTTEMALALTEMNGLAQKGKLFSGPPRNKTEAREEEKAKESLIKRFRESTPSGLFDKGMELIARNQPLVLGGLIGGLGSQLMRNPIAAASTAIAGLGVGAYVQWKQRNTIGRTHTGAEPSDNEDILDETGEPILTARALNMGDYIDAVSKRVIKTWSDIKGPIYDTSKNVVITAKQLSGKIFGPDGRELALRGLAAMRDAAVGAYDVLDPIGRIRQALELGKNMIYQQDVYVKGDGSPRLLGIKFKSGDYFVRDANGAAKPISGWNDITGPVYNAEGECLLTEDEVPDLITASGQAVRNVGTMGAAFAGGAAGLGKAAFNWGIERLGYVSKAGADYARSAASKAGVYIDGFNGTDASGNTDASRKPGGNLSGVERRLDRIYRLLSSYTKIPMEADPIDGTPGGMGEGLRLNSLADKALKEKEEEKHQVNEAIIAIAENTKDMGATDEKGEKKGIWGKITGLLGGMGGFLTNLIKNPLGAIGGLLMGGGKLIGGSLLKSTKTLASIGTAMFSGVLGAASPIFKLLRSGFMKLATAFAGSRLLRGRGGALGGGGLDDLGGDVAQRGQSGRRNGGKGKGRTRSRGRGKFGMLTNLAIGTGLAYGGSKLLESGEEDWDGSGDAGTYASDPNDITDKDTKNGARDPRTGHYRLASDTIIDTVTDLLPQGMLANAALDTVMSKDVRETTDKYGFFWSSDGSMFFNRDNMEAHEDKIRGVAKEPGGAYGAVKLPTGKPTTQKAIRFAMYGIVDMDSGLARRVELLESLLYPHVVISGGRAAFKAGTPIEQILQQFANAGNSKFNDASAIATWFMARFKPVFMIYNAAISIANMGDINEFDVSKQYDVIQVIERVQQSIATLDPYPYNIDVRIDTNMALMNDVLTRRWIDVLMEKLRKIIPSPVVNVEKIATDTQQRESIAAGTGNIQPTIGNETRAQDKFGALAAQSAQAAVDKKFSQPEQVKEIDISDMMPGKDQEMDPFVMTRLAAYGNVDNMSWRIEAVLRLERYIENFIMVIGDDVRFTGQSSRVLELFKPSFRIANDIAANNWMVWFRDRFLPVTMTYVKEVKKYRGGLPSKSWKQLSDTNRVVIARKLCEQLVATGDQQVSIWEISASPFPNSKSGPWADKADKYLKIMDAKAQEAKLKDPQLELEKSATVDERSDPTQRAQSASIRDRTEKALNDVYGTKQQATTGTFGVGGGGTGTSFTGAGSVNGSRSADVMMGSGGGAGSEGNFKGSANENFNPEFLKVAGEDKGIKMSPQQGEQLMLNHLVKAGITDNKTIALGLAMAKKETGNYQATVENTNWSAPTLLKYFKNIPDQATAQKVAAMSPPERAMWVYGRAPKGPSLGNDKPEDGWLYRGRGLFQLTGKSNYERFKKETGIDVVNNPKLVSEDPNVMAESAVRFLQNSKAMKSIAQTGDFNTAVRGINGGNAVPATDERRQYYNDYLNKLRNGELSIPGGGAPGGNEAPIDPGPTTETPAAADKNVPKDDMTNPASGNVAEPTGKDATKDLLKSQDPVSNASNMGSSAPEVPGTTSSEPAATSTPAVGSGATGVPTGDNNTSSSGMSDPLNEPKVTPKTSSVASAPIPQKQVPPQPVKAEVKLPENLATTDTTVAGLLAGTNQTLNRIAQILESQGKGNSLVKM